MIWDQSIARACDARAKAFLDDALAYGIASGVSIPLFDEVATKIVVDFVSKIPTLERHRRSKIHRVLGDMLVLARYFHELFKRAAIEKRIPARNAGMPISPREWTCLVMAAKGVAINSIAAAGNGSPLRANALRFGQVKAGDYALAARDRAG